MEGRGVEGINVLLFVLFIYVFLCFLKFVCRDSNVFFVKKKIDVEILVYLDFLVMLV